KVLAWIAVPGLVHIQQISRQRFELRGDSEPAEFQQHLWAFAVRFAAPLRIQLCLGTAHSEERGICRESIERLGSVRHLYVPERLPDSDQQLRRPGIAGEHAWLRMPRQAGSPGEDQDA